MDGQRQHGGGEIEEEEAGQQFCALQIHAEPRDCLHVMPAAEARQSPSNPPVVACHAVAG